jgi:nuclear pore complex protein Nup188
MGTLLELGNCTLDILRELVGRPGGQSIAAATSVSESSESPLDVKEGMSTARRHLEAILIYATTQLVMWFSKPELDTAVDMETDDLSSDNLRVEVTKDQKTRRTSQSFAERLRRGMSGEMAADLQSLLNKAKPIIEKSKSIVGPGEVDLIPILSTFLHERIAIP